MFPLAGFDVVKRENTSSCFVPIDERKKNLIRSTWDLNIWIQIETETISRIYASPNRGCCDLFVLPTLSSPCLFLKPSRNKKAKKKIHRVENDNPLKNYGKRADVIRGVLYNQIHLFIILLLRDFRCVKMFWIIVKKLCFPSHLPNFNLGHDSGIPFGLLGRLGFFMLRVGKAEEEVEEKFLV